MTTEDDMDKDSKWIDDLRRRTQGYERKAPEGLLGDIKKEMARRGSLPVSKHPSGEKGVVKHIRLLYLAAAAALVAVLIVVNLPKSDIGRIADAVKKEKYVDNRTENAMEEPVKTLADNAEKTPSNLSSYIRSAFNDFINDGTRAVALITESNRNIADGDGIVNSPLLAESIDKDAKPQSNEPMAYDKPMTRSMEKSARPTYWYKGSTQAKETRRDTEASFDISIGYSGMGGSTGNGGRELMAYNDAAVPSAYVPLTAFNKMEIEDKPQAHHDMPLKAGVSIRYNINNRWSVLSGVNYSYLSSDITRNSNVKKSTEKQKLHYVGIPLATSVNLWHNKNFNVYFTAGGEAAKLVKGKADVTSTVYGDKTARASETVSEHRLQYSVFGTGGVEFKATDRLSLYAEPGVTHYFDNHSSVLNIYKDKPTQFTINIGLRLNLNK